MTKTYGPYFQDIYNTEGEEGYIRTHYDATGFYHASLTKDFRKRGDTLMAELKKNFIEAINEHVLLPKAVIIVLEEDLIKAANHFKKGAGIVYQTAVDWLFTELHRISVSYKEKLPSKARKFRNPQFLWVAATYHDRYGNGNFYREKFNTALKNAAAKYREMQILHLHSWDQKDESKFCNGKLTADGFSKYWIALNDAFQAWDKEQMRLQQVKTSKFKTWHQKNNDRFHWSASAGKTKGNRFFLPKPPK